MTELQADVMDAYRVRVLASHAAAKARITEGALYYIEDAQGIRISGLFTTPLKAWRSAAEVCRANGL